MSRSTQKIISAIGIIAVIWSFSFQKAEATPNRNISLQVFYDELSYHGEWYNNPDYGYVWRPNVNRDFRPYYTNGHWVMTEFGNTWVSDYEWGWAPFHYGRWFYDRYDGWIWTPDTEWGPAWVTWRSGGGYYGWAPLAPRISININIGRRNFVPDNYWVFIPQRCIYYPSYSRYWEPRRNVYIVQRTTIINNYYTNRNVRYYTGPRADDIRRATRQNVPVYRVADQVRPGAVTVDRSTVNIYRPDVSRDDKAAPRVVASNNGRPTRTDNNGTRAGDNYNGSYNGGNANRPQTVDRPTRTGDDRINRVEPRPDANNDNVRPDVSRTSPSSGTNNNGTYNPQRNDRPVVDRNSSPSSNNGGSNRPDVDRSNSSRNTPTPSRTERPEPSRSTPSSSNRGNSPSGNSSNRPSRSENKPAKSVDRSSTTPSSSSSRDQGNQSGRPTRGN